MSVRNKTPCLLNPDPTCPATLWSALHLSPPDRRCSCHWHCQESRARKMACGGAVTTARATLPHRRSFPHHPIQENQAHRCLTTGAEKFQVEYGLCRHSQPQKPLGSTSPHSWERQSRREINEAWDTPKEPCIGTAPTSLFQDDSGKHTCV